MELWLNILFFLVSAVVLGFCGTGTVKQIIKLSHALKLRTFIVAFLLGALATSLPELFVVINASLIKNSGMVLGTIIGSNILDLTLVAGLTIIFARGIKIKSKSIRQDSLWMFGFALLPVILFAFGKSLSRIDAIIIIAAFIFYIRYLTKIRKEFRAILKERVNVKQIIIATSLLIMFIILLYYSAHFTIFFADKIVAQLRMPSLLIGLFFIALGTSLPELTLELRSIAMQHPDIALGDIMGSVIANSTLILAIGALISPVFVTANIGFIALIFMVVITYMFVTFLHSGNKLYVMEGIALLLLYLLFIVIEFYVGGFIGIT